MSLARYTVPHCTQKPVIRSQTGPYCIPARPAQPPHFPALGFRSVVGTLSLKPMHAWDVGFRQEVYTDPGILQTPTLLLGNSCSLLRVPAEDELREAAAAGSVLH